MFYHVCQALFIRSLISMKVTLNRNLDRCKTSKHLNIGNSVVSGNNVDGTSAALVLLDQLFFQIDT